MRFLTLKTCFSGQRKSVSKKNCQQFSNTLAKSNEWIVLFNQRTPTFSGICTKIITNGEVHFQVGHTALFQYVCFGNFNYLRRIIIYSFYFLFRSYKSFYTDVLHLPDTFLIILRYTVHPLYSDCDNRKQSFRLQLTSGARRLADARRNS